MKKYTMIILSFVLFSVILGSIVVSAFSVRQFTANEVDFKIIINGKECGFEQPIVTIEDRTYLPIREFCDAIGYDINWDSEKEEVLMSNKKNIFSDSIKVSREGILENGRKYIFHGIDEQNFNIKDYIEQMELFTSMVYDERIQDGEIETIIQKIQVLFGLNNIPAEMAGINGYYDTESDAMLFMKDYYGVPQPGGLNVIVVNCKDGLTTLYSSKMA